MTTYSLLFIDSNETIARSKRIKCSTDHQALKIAAQEIEDSRAVQVWAGDRPVSIVGKLQNIIGEASDTMEPHPGLLEQGRRSQSLKPSTSLL